MAEKILIPSSSANLAASGVIRTSNASNVANSFFYLLSSAANAFIAFITSFLWTGPIEILTTGILDVFKNSSKASREPKVEAWTQTPSYDLSTYLSRIS